MVYEIRIRPSAARSLRRLDGEMKSRIGEAIDGLSTNPRPSGCKKLAGSEGVYRIRVGHYRVLYQVKDRELIVLVVAVGHRREVYR